MNWEKLTNWHVYWNKRSKLSRLDLDSGYTSNRYHVDVILYVQLKKNGA